MVDINSPEERFTHELMGCLQTDFEEFIKGSQVGPQLQKAGFKEAANATFAAGFASGMKFSGDRRKRKEV